MAHAAQVYLVEQWQNHNNGTPIERRNEICREFVGLGMRNRWEYHRLAENAGFTEEQGAILALRTQEETCVADWASYGAHRIVFSTGKHNLSSREVRWCTGTELGGDEEKFVSYDIDALPERVYSMTAFDDPTDVEEAKQEHDQSLWVSGVYWVADADDGLRIIWNDEFGDPIRQKICHLSELEAGSELFDAYKPFETTWWTEASPVGRYARDEWWKLENHP